MVVYGSLRVYKLLFDAEQIEYKVFHIVDVKRVTPELVDIATNRFDLVKLWKVMRDVDFFSHHFILQEIHFIEEQYDGDLGKSSMIDYSVKYVSGFFQSIDSFILKQTSWSYSKSVVSLYLNHFIETLWFG